MSGSYWLKVGVLGSGCCQRVGGDSLQPCIATDLWAVDGDEREANQLQVEYGRYLLETKCRWFISAGDDSDGGDYGYTPEADEIVMITVANKNVWAKCPKYDKGTSVSKQQAQKLIPRWRYFLVMSGLFALPIF